MYAIEKGSEYLMWTNTSLCLAETWRNIQIDVHSDTNIRNYIVHVLYLCILQRD